MNKHHAIGLALLALLVTALVSLAWYGYGSHPARLTLVTGPEGGGFHALGVLLRDAVHDSDPQITINVLPSDGSIDNRRRLKERTADLAIVQNDTDPDKVDIQTLIPLHRSIYHFLVHKDSSIDSIYDLRGKRVGVGAPESGNLHVAKILLGHFGIAMEELTAIQETFVASRGKLASNQLDALLVMTAINSPALTTLVQSGDVRYVSLASLPGQGNEVDGFAVTYPYVKRFTIPQFVYPVSDERQGLPAKPCETFALRSSLVCRGDLPDSVARSIVSAIVSHRTSMMRESRIAHDITEHFDPDEIQFPIHHGAMAYYQRQRPGFLERYSEPMAFALSLFLALCGLVAGFNKWMVVRKKNRIDRYYSRLDDLLTELNAPQQTLQRLDTIEQELLTIRHDAVRELVAERLLANDSFQIFQSLLTDCHHQISLRRQVTR